MIIEHAALYFTDLERAKSFFVRYFGASCGSGYHNVRMDFRSYFLTFDGGARLEIMQKPGMDAPEKSAGYHHIAFGAGSVENVDALTGRLRTDGYEVVSGPRVTGDGYYESCVLGPEGTVIEITV